MKPNKIFSILIATTLLPAFAYAGPEMISPEGGRHCDLANNAITITVAPEASTNTKPDPLEDEVNALVNSTNDPVAASYYRDLYHGAGPSGPTQFVLMTDPYQDAVSLALYGQAEVDSRLVC